MDGHGLSVGRHDYHGLFMDYHGLPWATIDYSWTAMDGLTRPPMGCHGLPWNHHRPPWTAMGDHALFMAGRGLPCTTMVYYGLVMDYHGLPRTFHGLPRTTTHLSWAPTDYHGLPQTTVGCHGPPWTPMQCS